MAVFENLRNFIRHGKQADGSKAAVDPGAGAHCAHSARADRASGKSRSSDVNVDNRRKYDIAIKQIIAEENEQRNKLPTYPGLEKYTLVEKMGDGAFSVVYKAIDNATNENRAIKVVAKNHLSGSQRASVLKEAAIMRQLKHENIVQLYAFLETPENYFMVLELLPGGELFHQIVRLTYFSEDLSRHVIVQVASAIRYLHEVAGVVHRDIKPENLLFVPCEFRPSKQRVVNPYDDESKEDEGEFIPNVGGGGIGVIKLADFGLSKVIWDSKTMTPCGTVGYTAPEIVKDETYSKSVDMWALGCVLYTVLCGFPPFYDESIEALTRKVAKGEYTFLSPWWDSISTSAKDLISHLLTVDPDKRYTIDEFLRHPWITQDGTVPIVESKEVAARKSAAASIEVEKRLRDPAKGGVFKDAFDVSNAVYRMEQDIAHRGDPSVPTVPEIIEEEEEEEEEEGVAFSHVEDLTSGVKNMSLAKSSNKSKNRNGGRHRHHIASLSPGPELFDLHLEGATLLERRKQSKGTQVLV